MREYTIAIYGEWMKILSVYMIIAFTLREGLLDERAIIVHMHLGWDLTGDDVLYVGQPQPGNIML